AAPSHHLPSIYIFFAVLVAVAVAMVVSSGSGVGCEGILTAESVIARRARPFPTLSQKLLEKALALAQGPPPVGEVAFVGAVLDLDADRAAVAGVRQCGEKGTPGHVAKARQLGRVPA